MKLIELITRTGSRDDVIIQVYLYFIVNVFNKALVDLQLVES